MSLGLPAMQTRALAAENISAALSAALFEDDDIFGGDEEAADDEDSDKEDEEADVDNDSEKEDIPEFDFEEEVKVKDQLDWGEDEGYSIVPMCGAGRSLDVDGGNGYKSIQLFKTKRTANQIWNIRKSGDYYYLTNQYNNRALEVTGGKATTEAAVGVADYTGADKQLWVLEDTGEGTYLIKSKLDQNYVLEVKDYSYDSGAKVFLHKKDYGYNQRFRFVHVSTVEPVSDWGASRHDCLVTDPDMWDGSSDTSWYFSDKNAKIYEISNASQLAGIAQLVNNGTTRFYGRGFVLTKDINLCGLEWTRIGTSDHPFEGNFDGQGHAIVGLSITQTSGNDTGFFGYVNGSCISNLAIKGYVTGKKNTGGLVGRLNRGYIYNVYSEVRAAAATDDNMAGICGWVEVGGSIEHCTQNAPVYSNNEEPTRGGIAGYASGVIRYCVNMSSVYCNWNYAGGILGECVDAKVEYCANYGSIGGGKATERAGGIAGRCRGEGLIFGCFNEGDVTSTGDDHIGGICGKREDSGRIMASINTGDVKGHNRVGGIIGSGNCTYCFNAGQVSGNDDVGAVTGDGNPLSWCRALSWTSARLNGNGDNNGAEWISAADVAGGKLCHDLNRWEDKPDLGDYGLGWDMIFFQNIGGDAFPTFTGQKVNKSLVNEAFEVRAEYSKEYGYISGAGVYTSGPVTIKAYPAAGYLFDHFEISTVSVGKKAMYNGDHDYPFAEAILSTATQLTLTDNINSSYVVKAVFKPDKEMADEINNTVKVEIECTDSASGWNSSNIPVILNVSSGEKYTWDVPRDDLNGSGKKVTNTFEIGTALPLSLEARPDFGGGMTVRSMGLVARIWINGSETPLETNKVTIRSYPFVSSLTGGDYMYLAFEDSGSSSVGLMSADGTLDVKGTYDKPSQAWDAALKLGKGAVIRLENVWLTNDRLYMKNTELTLDLNGYPIIRSMRGLSNNGEVIEVDPGASLTIIDSTPDRKTSLAFNGGSIQGGRNKNGGGLIDVEGTLVMKGGTLYNGWTTNVGGGIKSKGGTVTLENTQIMNCQAVKASGNDNNGGAIAVTSNGNVTLTNCSIRGCSAYDKGGAIHMNGGKSTFTMINTDISSCRAQDDEGGAIYLDGGTFKYTGGNINNCSAPNDDAGAVFQNNGSLRIEAVRFESNHAKNCGGAAFINTNDPTWFIGCDFISNIANDDGGAIYLDDNYLYLEDCTVTANASTDKGGGLYLEDSGSIDLRGRMVISNNDGVGVLDNLVMEKGANVYDLGLTEGSEVHLCSTKDGEVRLASTKHFISEYQMNNYFISDKTGLKLDKQEVRETRLQASAVSEGTIAIIAGGALLAAGLVTFIIVMYKRRKGAQS